MDSNRFIKTSELTQQDHTRIRAFLSDKPCFDFYYRASLHELKAGIDNRSYSLNGNETLIMAIHFDDCNIFTPIGAINNADAILHFPERAELHIEEHQAELFRSKAKNRIHWEGTLRYYRFPDISHITCTDNRCSRLSPDDLDEVSAFYHQYYPETVFSSYMLEQPFIGLRENNELIATAGTMVSLETECHIGNFLTHPDKRGKGLAKTVGSKLLEELCEDGFKSVSLGVNEENIPAWKAYESLGFELDDKRIVLMLSENTT